MFSRRFAYPTMLSVHNLGYMRKYIKRELTILKRKNNRKGLRIIEKGRQQLKAFQTELDRVKENPDLQWEGTTEIQTQEKFKALQKAIQDLGNRQTEPGWLGSGTGIPAALGKFKMVPHTIGSRIMGMFQGWRKPGSPARASRFVHKLSDSAPSTPVKVERAGKLRSGPQ